jgi:leader peptidase (prepilin peptidase) / N-methyltransferase
MAAAGKRRKRREARARMSGLPVYLLAAFGAVAGAIAGSFLNVVIHRTPRIIDGGDKTVSVWEFLHGLASPPSHCPQCKTAVGWRDNIPVLSYLFLRGRCRGCRQPYGARYVVVEAVSAVAAGFCAVHFGATPMAVFAGIFVLGLIALTFIDIEEQLLPDALVFPLFALGLVFNIVFHDSFYDACAGAFAGFAALWVVRASYQAYSGIEGLGFGDLKLAAMIGAWLGLAAIPAVLFLAFAIGVVFMGPLLLFGRLDQRTPVPFGPFLAISAACVLALPALAGFPMTLFAPY